MNSAIPATTFEESQHEFDEVIAKLAITADASDFVKMNVFKACLLPSSSSCGTAGL